MFHILFEKVNKFYEKVFEVYGRFLAKYHIYVIVVSLLVNLILSLGILKLKMITDTDTLFMPIDSQAKQDEKIVKRIFNTEKTLANNYFIHQTPDLGTWAEINFMHNDPNESLIHPDYLSEMKKINDYLLDNVHVKVNDSYKVDYRKVCAKRMNYCVIEGYNLMTNMFYEWLKDNVEQISNGTKSNDLQWYFCISQDSVNITNLKLSLGKDFTIIPKSSPGSQDFAFARVLKVRYNLKSDNENADELVLRWEEEFLSTVRRLSNENATGKSGLLKHLKISYATSHSLDVEIEKNIILDTNLISGTFCLIFIFSMIMMSINTNCVTSPGILLPMSGIFSAMFAITSAFGLLSYLNYPGCNLIFVIPFLVIGIGIDDMFIIYSSFQHGFGQIKKEDESYLSKLIVYTLSKSGVSITITSLTDFVAFIVGLTTNFRSVQMFCLYVAVAILICYLNQLTIFSGFLCIHVKRIEKNKNAFLFCVNQEQFKCAEADDLDNCNQNETRKTSEFDLNDDEANNKPLEKKPKKFKKLRKFLSHPIRHSKTFLKQILKFLITHTLGKCLVIFVYFIYLGLSIYSASHIEEGLSLGDLVSTESYFHSYINDNMGLFDQTPIVMLIVDKPLNYDDLNIRIKLKTLLNKAQEIDGLTDIPVVVNWLDPLMHINAKIDYAHNIDNLYSKFAAFPNFKNDFLIEKKEVFNKANNKTEWEYLISASRLYLKYDKVYFSSKDSKPMYLLRKLCDESELPVFPYSFAFKFYEQFEQTLPNILQTFLISIESMYLIALIFIPDLISVFCIIMSMGSIMVGMIGLMYAWGLTLNSVTMIELIMSVGFCIDFSAHVVHAFIASVGPGSRNERAYKACIRVGMPIFSSALSTIIGISLLAFCKSYMFVTFFKTLLILMSLGIVNSLLFLPVLLSLVGPDWQRHRRKESQAENVVSGLNENETSQILIPKSGNYFE